MVDLDSEDDHVDGALERAQAKLYRGDLAANGVFWCCAIAIGKSASSDSKVARTEDGAQWMNIAWKQFIYSAPHFTCSMGTLRPFAASIRRFACLQEALWHIQ